MNNFIFVTQSDEKISEARRVLGKYLEFHKLDIPELQAKELEEVVEYKVKYAYEALGKKSVMIEDTGLFISAWNGLPGALVKWFIGSVGDTGICRMMQDFPDKRALAKTVIATYDGDIKIFKGEVRGKIAQVPIGENGWGFDKLFIPDTTCKTFGEMSDDEKDIYSMRRLAFESMKHYYYRV